jgi:CubicO group peptidase (beta-lactamase class C family)
VDPLAPRSAFVGRALRGLLALVAASFIACGSSSPASGPSDSPSVAPPIDIAQPWRVSAPVDAGLDPGRLAQAAADAAAIPRVRALLVARHGQLALERYFGGADASQRFDVRSVTKSVVSLLVGQAIARGTLPGLDASVGQYLGAPYVMDAGDAAVSVRELLTMTSGYAWDETNGDDYNQWILAPDHVQYLLDRPRTGRPGSFTYNSAAVHLLGVVLQQAAGRPLPELADEQLFRPIGVSGVAWEQLEAGTVNGGSGIQLAGQDLLRLGQLVLQRGWSGGQAIVPEGWLAEATTPRFPWRDSYGAQRSVSYGYLWWVADAPASPASFAWGYGGQFVYVVPSLDLVAVTTTAWENLGADQLTAIGLADSLFGVIVNDVLPATAGRR